MTDIATAHFLCGLKELYGQEEFSDKVLHIVEIDEEIVFRATAITSPSSSCCSQTSTIVNEINSTTDSLSLKEEKEETLFKEENKAWTIKDESSTPRNHTSCGGKRKLGNTSINKKTVVKSKVSKISHVGLCDSTMTTHLCASDKEFINEKTETHSANGNEVGVVVLDDGNGRDTLADDNTLNITVDGRPIIIKTGANILINTSRNIDLTDKKNISENSKLEDSDSDSKEKQSNDNGKIELNFAKVIVENTSFRIEENKSNKEHSDLKKEETNKYTFKQHKNNNTQNGLLSDDAMSPDRIYIERNQTLRNNSLPLETVLLEDDGSECDMIEVVPFLVIPVHSIVMCLNSKYFKTLLTTSGMKETYEKYVTIQVNVGEGQYLQKLIHAFYDYTVLNGLGALELLHVLEIANRFSCDIYMQKCAALLKNANVKSLAECTTMLLHIKKLELRTELFGPTCEDLRQCCIQFLVKSFCPLESRTNRHDDFLSLNYHILCVLLQSNKSMSWSENSLLMFVAAWLDHDESRLTSSNIETLLRAINIQLLTPDFLFDEITINHAIFNLWENFNVWFVDAIAHHGFTRNRSLKHLSYSRQDYKDNIFVPGWLVTFELVGSNFFPLSDDSLTLWRGYVIKPRLFITEHANDKKLYELKIHVTHSTLPEVSLFHHFDLGFTLAIAILPRDESYNELVFSSKCRKFVKQHFREVNINFHSRTDYCSFGLGYVTKDFLQITNGLQVAMAFKAEKDKWPVFMRTISNLESNKCYLDKTTSYWQWYHDDFVGIQQM